MAQRQRHQCCFCGLTIESKPPDVGSLIYTTCIDGEPEMQHSQENFCHTKCLRDRLHAAVKLYAVDLLQPGNKLATDENSGTA